MGARRRARRRGPSAQTSRFDHGAPFLGSAAWPTPIPACPQNGIEPRPVWTPPRPSLTTRTASMGANLLTSVLCPDTNPHGLRASIARRVLPSAVCRLPSTGGRCIPRHTREVQYRSRRGEPNGDRGANRGLRELREEALHAGSQRAIARQHEQGKLTARERLDALLDKGSFQEIDQFVRHQSSGFGIEDKRPLGDAVVTGHGTSMAARCSSSPRTSPFSAAA